LESVIGDKIIGDKITPNNFASSAAMEKALRETKDYLESVVESLADDPDALTGED
jgi:hypothetical protein